MPAIASLEDLKATQKEGVSIYAMLYALCSTEMAPHWMEKYLQTLARGTDTGGVERGG
jgi:hypothetical protein